VASLLSRKEYKRYNNSTHSCLLIHLLAHLIDVPALKRVYRRQRAEAAVGVDGSTEEQYGQDLGATLQDVQARLKAKRYRPQPIRRVHLPTGQGKTRPIRISACEDKLVQDAVREVLEDASPLDTAAGVSGIEAMREER
jgi:retron-type reverse transcriptase